MAVVGVDSSGRVAQPPIWFLATKTTTKQRISIVKISKDYHDEFIDRANNWKEKLSAAIIFATLKDFVSEADSIVLDSDWQQKNDFVAAYLRKMFSYHYGKGPLADPSISFGTKKSNTNVRHADRKSHFARWGRYDNQLRKDPPIRAYFDLLG